MPNMPPLPQRKRRRPRNIMEANVRSLVKKMMRANLSPSKLTGLQPEVSDHEEWSCEEVSTICQKESGSSLPGRWLMPNKICKAPTFKFVCRR
jgi:hypothetical protein